MAKSIRSKHRRKMRNIKRQHYAKKDLDKLKTLAAKSSELGDLVTMKNVEEIKEKQKVEKVSDQTEDATMDVDKAQKNYDKRTLQDEHGHYPPWMNQRAIKKQKAKIAKSKKKVGNKIKW
ncbi:protein LLP-like [Physella acuta]|uniref:protein LLP-like n=1 Tax=Physella acuta TaxID=109671 RepID=UPI0027DD4377|nr:protein LLP-like [Physella acuta]